MNKFKPESPNSIEAHLSALYGRINYERQVPIGTQEFKLHNMQQILARLGNPHLQYPVVHVAGTKGKGSVSTMIGEILHSSGRRTGVYTSPHLEAINQRMAIDGQMISDEQLAQTLTQLAPVIEQMDDEADQTGQRRLTFFEIITATAMVYFANEKCDAVVLEVGLGGRLDSTNQCEPAVCVITNISIDHTRQLGSTLDKIAFEKAGIIKPSVPVVSGATAPEAAQVIRAVAAEKKSALFVLEQDFSIHLAAEDDQTFACSGNLSFDPASKSGGTQTTSADQTPANHSFNYHGLKLRLLGQHQRTNAAIAVTTIEVLNAQGWNISAAQIRRGLETATLAGRAEIVSHRPTIMLDIAHNVASINALMQTIRQDVAQWRQSSKRTLILAISRDKDAAGILEPLVEYFDQIVLTKFQDNPRGKSEQALAKIALAIQQQRNQQRLPAASIITEPTPQSAWHQVSANMKPDEFICISGSVFLIAELRKTILMSVQKTIT